MPRRANYGFEKRQKELKRQHKKEEKAARKRQKKEAGGLSESGDVAPENDDLASDGSRAGEANP